MLKIRKANERGHANYGWLDTYHSFSFADYHDDNYISFQNLRVINEDIVDEGKGFATHPHRHMEIITYVTEGALEHKDSMGNGSIIRPGEVQVMSAGTGVTHSEFNHSQDEKVHLFQIWILPNQVNTEPRYQQKMFGDARKDQLCCVVSPDGREGSLEIYQDSSIYASILSPGKELKFHIEKGRHVWIQVIKGEMNVNEAVLNDSDGLAISDLDQVTLFAHQETEFLLFDLNKAM